MSCPGGLWARLPECPSPESRQVPLIKTYYAGQEPSIYAQVTLNLSNRCVLSELPRETALSLPSLP